MLRLFHLMLWTLLPLGLVQTASSSTCHSPSLIADSFDLGSDQGYQFHGNGLNGLRLGEASNPGPPDLLTIGTTNPSGLRNKEQHAVDQGRVLATQHYIGQHVVTVITIYGLPRGPRAASLTNEILEYVTKEFIVGYSGIVIVNGDFNFSPYELPCFDVWRAYGYCSAQEHARVRWSQPISPTCKSTTERDLLWLSPMALSICQSVDVEEVFQDHASVSVQLQLDFLPTTLRTWPRPSEIPWQKVDVEAWHQHCDGLEPSVQDNPTQTMQELAASFEQSMNGFVQDLPQNSLSTAHCGRAQRLQPASHTPTPRTCRASRPGEAMLVADTVGQAVIMWFRQRAELWACISTTEWALKYDTDIILWTDSAGTCSHFNRLMTGSVGPDEDANEDLWLKLADLLAHLRDGQIEVRWIPSHVDYALCSDTSEEFLAVWNNVVDQQAVATNLQRGPTFEALLTEANEHYALWTTRLRALRDFYFGVARSRQDEPDIIDLTEDSDELAERVFSLSLGDALSVSWQHQLRRQSDDLALPVEFVSFLINACIAEEPSQASFVAISFVELTLWIAQTLNAQFPIEKTTTGQWSMRAPADMLLKPTVASLSQKVRSGLKSGLKVLGLEHYFCTGLDRRISSIDIPVDGILLSLPAQVQSHISGLTSAFCPRKLRKAADVAKPYI
eukprot:s865_g24.t1